MNQCIVSNSWKSRRKKLCTWNKVVGEEELKIFWKVPRQINWKTYLNHIKTSSHKNKLNTLTYKPIVSWIGKNTLGR